MSQMEYELYDDGSDMKDIFGGNIMKKPVSVVWEGHANIERNRERDIGSGRLITDESTRDKLLKIVFYWIR